MAQADDSLGFPALIYRLASRNPLKLGVMLIVGSCLWFLISGVLFFARGSGLALQTGVDRLGADLMIIPAGEAIELNKGLIGGAPVSFSLPATASAEIKNESGIKKLSAQYFVSSAEADCCEAGNLFLIGFDPDTDFTLAPWINEGAATFPDIDSIWVGGAVNKKPGAGLLLYNHSFKVVGRMSRTGMGYFDNSVFISLDGLREMLATARLTAAAKINVDFDRPSFLLLKLDDAIDSADFAVRLEKDFHDIDVVAADEFSRELGEKMSELTRIIYPVSIFGWILAVLLGAAVWLLYWTSRKQSLGLMLSLGADAPTIIKLFLAEASLLAISGATIGSALSFWALSLFEDYFHLQLGLPLSIDLGLIYSSGALAAAAIYIVATQAPSLLFLSIYLRRDPYYLIRSGR